ncbi:LruC domain-containing protein [Motilimonas pumila]|uniref:LruC domain-containing protein n=1 Tax=Motilimonas pumila TaxID=2303987 RepID=A0A418YD98_9GAMM|nr:LruC domain-containing protein [Motilimonas pumila]RJG42473.1 LruC domain-containing protein [Motilimonas pumila]
MHAFYRLTSPVRGRYFNLSRTALLGSMLTLSLSAQGGAFSSCPSKAFLLQGKPVATYGVNLVTGNFEQLSDSPGINANINGVGFNESDRYIYGFDTSNLNLVRLGDDFQSETLNVSGLPSNTSFFVGDVANHHYYLYRTGVGFYKINLAPLDSDSQGQLTAELISANSNIRLTDFAFHPQSKKLYGVDNKTGVLYQIDPDTGATQALGDTGETGTFGAMYFDVNGYFYLSRNQDGLIYRIDLSSVDQQADPHATGLDVSAVLFSSGPMSSQNDGARCANAPLIDEDSPSNIDFGDAPATYGTRLADNGARHLLDGETYLGLAAPDGDYDGYQSPDSDDTHQANNDSFDDEDGVQFVTAFEIGLDSVVRVIASKPGYLNAWFDWDQNGQFEASQEHDLNDVYLQQGINIIQLRVPQQALAGNTWSRFRFSQQAGLGPTGGSSSGEVEDHQIAIVDGDVLYQHFPSESGVVTLVYEDQWPATDDYDMNDVVMAYRTTQIIRDGQVIRVDIHGKLLALGGSYHSGFGIALPNILTSQINQEAVRLWHNGQLQTESGRQGADTFPILELNNQFAVVTVKQDLWQGTQSNCEYFRTEKGCDQSPQFEFDLSIPFNEPINIANFPNAALDPFIFATPGFYHGDNFTNQAGRSLEIHLVDQAPTERFNPAFYGLAQDTSEPTKNRYFRNANHLPWALMIPGEWQWPKERQGLLHAYPRFKSFVESNGVNDWNWFEPKHANETYLFK